MSYQIEIIIEEKENHYEAYAPKVPNCKGQGESYEMALKNTREALQTYIGRLNEDEKAILGFSPQH